MPMMNREGRRTLDGMGSLAMRSSRSRGEARVAWLLDRLRERARRREVSELLEELIGAPSGPGQTELAIVELAMHHDPAGRVALRVWRPACADHEELRAVCLGE